MLTWTSRIGTIAEIRDAGSYDDGRYDLLVVGTRRFEIRQVINSKQPYLVADVDLLDESVGDDETAHRLAMRATRRFVTYLELLQPRSGETADEIDVRVEIETEDEDDTDGDAEAPDAALETEDDESDEEATERETDLGVGSGSSAQPPSGEGDADSADDESEAPRRRRVTIPDDPTVLSHLLAGILQVEAPRRQALLEAATTEDRLRGLLGLIDRETILLQRRLRFFRPEARVIGARRS